MHVTRLFCPPLKPLLPHGEKEVFSVLMPETADDTQGQNIYPCERGAPMPVSCYRSSVLFALK
jgi:hypothetical protein